MINREAMEFHFDWDSDNEMIMKNYNYLYHQGV